MSTPASASPDASSFDDEGDFATEHCEFTVGDLDYGPEGVPEHESPKGYGGADWSWHRQFLV